MSKFFITGANGFVGKYLCLELEERGISFSAGVRTSKASNEIAYGDFTIQKNWDHFLIDVDVVVHLAARVHVMKEHSGDPLAAFLAANCEATVNLASAAKRAGVKRFIFISSVKVNGEETYQKAYTANDKPMPQDPYGISKMEAEKALMNLHEAGLFEVVIIRPPLIYGPGVKANFKNLLNLVEKGIPLPFGKASENKRSLVSIYNLVDLIILCSHHKNAGGEIFLVSDDQDLSLKELIIKMGKVLNKTPYLLPIPIALLKGAAILLGKRSYADRLFGNLQVDISETKKKLNWNPLYSFEETFLIK
jgi:nucleoside-diphosphate-sugar epimerase